MIVFEDGIEGLVDQIPAIGGFKPVFHWGDESELRRFIHLKDQKYPLVWLTVSPEDHSLKGNNEITRKCRFILATKAVDSDQLNDARLRGLYDTILNPLVDRLIEGFKKFHITDLIGDNVKVVKYPNYSKYDGAQKTEKNYSIDLWDAITIECSIKMNDYCQNTIQWQKI